jgi:hypothetical protein
MKSVLFDATGDAAAGRSLSPEAPAGLVNCDVIAAFVSRLSQFEGRGDGRATAADDSDLKGLSNRQSNRQLSFPRFLALY